MIYKRSRAKRTGDLNGLDTGRVKNSPNDHFYEAGTRKYKRQPSKKGAVSGDSSPNFISVILISKQLIKPGAQGAGFFPGSSFICENSSWEGETGVNSNSSA